LWSRLIRDVLAPLAGVGIEIFEAVWAAPPSQVMVVAGLGMIWGPIDAVTALLGRRLGSPPEQPRSPSREGVP
jgi:hypothetical protein